MAADIDQPVQQHQLDFTLYNVPATTVRIDFPAAAAAETMMLTAMPSLQLNAGYTDAPTIISSMYVQPRRILFEIASAPSQLPISLQIACKGPFVFGWLLVPENVQTVI